MMHLSHLITANRHTYIAALKSGRWRQVHSVLISANECRCAVGVGAALFELSLEKDKNGFHSVYEELAQRLGSDIDLINQIIAWNDIHHLSLDEIGRRLEEIWFPSPLGVWARLGRTIADLNEGLMVALGKQP